MMTRKKDHKRSDIVTYWKNAGAYLFSQFGAGHKLQEIEIGRPACFACSRPGKEFYSDLSLDNWNKYTDVAFENCHIVPFALDPTLDVVSNIVILCKDCHKLNPHTTCVESYFNWLAGVEHYKKTDQAMQNKALKQVGFDLDTYERQQKKYYAEINKHKDYLENKFWIQVNHSNTKHRYTKPNYATIAAITKKTFLDLNLKMSDDQFKLF